MTASGELDLIEWIRRRCGSDPRVPVGIGDDAAVAQIGDGRSGRILAAADMLVEGTHFSADTPPERVGYKALAVNLSDMAAMAARPTAALVCLGLSRQRSMVWAQQLMDGLIGCAEQFGVALIGGDTTTADGPTSVAVTVLGHSTGSGPVLRSGARAGDWVFVSGPLGGSLAGHHLNFTPRLKLAEWLQQQVSLHAMIDLSDGLALDARRIAEASGVGMQINVEALPIADAARESADGGSPVDHALGDGEDFELLWTCGAEDGRKLQQLEPPEGLLQRIGEVVSGNDVWLLDSAGHRTPAPRIGYEHRVDE